MHKIVGQLAKYEGGPPSIGRTLRPVPASLHLQLSGMFGFSTKTLPSCTHTHIRTRYFCLALFT